MYFKYLKPFSFERNNFSRRIGHKIVPAYVGHEQADDACVRQTYDLLSFVDVNECWH